MDGFGRLCEKRLDRSGRLRKKSLGQLCGKSFDGRGWLCEKDSTAGDSCVKKIGRLRLVV